MKYCHVILLSLFLLPPSYTGAVDAKLEYDEVRIGYIPSRAASYQGKPHVALEAKSLIHQKNMEIEKFFIALSSLASKGITDNATRFHEPTIYIEAIYQGERVRLFFSGDSQLDKFSHYERRWKSLHEKLYEYLNKEVSPNHRFNLTP